MSIFPCHLSSRLLKGKTPLNGWKSRKLEAACVEADAALHEWKAELFGRACGVVLEIGAGSGLNRKYLQRAQGYVALEPGVRSCDHLKSIADAVLCSSAESIPLPSASVDSVICSMALCSVKNLFRTLDEIYRVLRPNGSCLLIEHVGAPNGTWLRACQWLFRPVCQYLDFGCQPDRDTRSTLNATDFVISDLKEFQLELRSPLIRNWIVATLEKPHVSHTKT